MFWYIVMGVVVGDYRVMREIWERMGSRRVNRMKNNYI